MQSKSNNNPGKTKRIQLSKQLFLKRDILKECQMMEILFFRGIFNTKEINEILILTQKVLAA
jgi:hypothetical protein